MNGMTEDLKWKEISM
jgi:hypothetical protein